MLTDLWLVQPLAFARGGSSDEPLDAFDWAPPDLSPEGSGRTQIVPADTLLVDPETGKVSLRPASQIPAVRFKDDHDRIRPVCPFFELHGVWNENGVEEEIEVTPDVLTKIDRKPGDLKWTVEFRNSKAWHWTKQDGDRIEAKVEMRGNEHMRQELKGVAHWAAINPLVPSGRHIPLGSVQLTCPNDEFPGFRLRFTPGKGKAYAPSNLKERLARLTYPGPKEKMPADMLPIVWDLLKANNQWKGFELPPERCFLNPNAAWAKYHMFSEMEIAPAVFGVLSRLVTVDALTDDPSQQLRLVLGGVSDDFDPRNLPPGLYARVTELPFLLASLGMVDDFGDGVISCSLNVKGRDLTAHARVVSGPPDFAPDRRPVVSIADGLIDRSGRQEVRDGEWVRGANKPMAELEVQDLMDRAFETMGLANVDATNDYFQIENVNRQKRERPSAAEAKGDEKLWTEETPITGEREAYLRLVHNEHWTDKLPLTSLGRDAHRRNAVRAFFEALVLKYPDFMKKFVRVPGGPDRYYDRKMPGLMRGADRMPLHLTRRQYDLLKNWVKSLGGGHK